MWTNSKNYKIAVAEGKVTLREGTSQAGVDNQPCFESNVITKSFSPSKRKRLQNAIARLKVGKNL